MSATIERLPLPKEFDPLMTEIETYFRELPRLLAKGNAGKIALVKGHEVTVWDTTDDALQHSFRVYDLAQTLCQPIDARDIERLAPFMPHPEGSAGVNTFQDVIDTDGPGGRFTLAF